MTEEEWVQLVWILWIREWPYSTQQDRAELLATKDHVEQVSGWCWSAPYQLDNPPQPTESEHHV